MIPKLQETYTLKKEVTIIGHSFGAYFSTYCFFKNNELFNNCIAISPAYWPNDKDIYAIAEEELSKKVKLTGTFYLAIGDKRWDDVSLREGVFKFKSMIESKDSHITIQFQDLVGFNHNSSPTVGFGLGLGFCFDQWEWESVVEEQTTRISSFPDFWRHYELKADALNHLDRTNEANEVYRIAIDKLNADKEISKAERKIFLNRLKQKIIN